MRQAFAGLVGERLAELRRRMRLRRKLRKSSQPRTSVQPYPKRAERTRTASAALASVVQREAAVLVDRLVRQGGACGRSAVCRRGLGPPARPARPTPRGNCRARSSARRPRPGAPGLDPPHADNQRHVPLEHQRRNSKLLGSGSHGRPRLRPNCSSGNAIAAWRQESSAKKAAMSRASGSGSSAAAKWPPRGIGVQRRTS